LNQRDEIAPLLVNWTNDINTIYGTDFKYSYPLDMIIKHATIEYGFSFWRSIDLGCDDIPDANTSAETLFNHMVEIVDFIQDFTDYGVNFWKPYYFQTTTEIGEIDYPTEHIDDLLQPLDPFFEFETTNTFSPEIMMDIANWVKSESTNIIFIYGQDDPWTIAAYEVTGNSNVFKFIAPQTKHEASIENLESVDKVKVHEVIQGWLGN
jgi:hypothetical protein